MKRLTLILMLLGCMLITACDRSKSQNTESQASQTTTDMRSYTDAAGRQLTIPRHPKRIIALSEVDLDAMLALGVKPVAATDGRGQEGFPRYLDESQTQGITSVGRLGNPSMEAILMAKPDLILLGGFYTDQALEKLSAIAPVVVTYTLREDWKKGFERVAGLLDKQDAYDTFMAQYDQRIQQVRKRLDDHIHDTVSIIRWNPKGPMFMYNTVFASKVISDIGLKRPEYQDKDGAPHSPILSLESLDQLDGDWIFMGTLMTQGDAVSTMASATSTPAFKALKGVQNGHLIPVDGSLWTSVGGPLAAMQVLDDVQKAMSQADE
ncbi:MAG: ABC transporter substrate-binding protein [Phycisphaeraceae bacterium]|nr:ABC transporter substrate-binding protein [Phycisphaeraceae bacterium]